MSPIYLIGFMVFLCGISTYGIFQSIKKKFIIFALFLACILIISLICFFSVVPTILIDDNVLLQINATIIAGALILLTITSFVSSRSHKPIMLKRIAFTPFQVASGVIMTFSVSTIFLFFHESHDAKIFAVLGFLFLIFSSIIIAWKEPFSQQEAE